MGRAERHPAGSILDAARELVLADGLRTATVDRIVVASGAPKGSIYHRFGTLDDLLATMWLRAVRASQDRFLAALDGPGDAVTVGVAAALTLHDFAREEPDEAALLITVRRRDVERGIRDEDLARRLTTVNAPIERGVEDLATRLYGRADRQAVERTVLAVVDLPLGAIRRHLLARRPPPPELRDPLGRAVRAALQD
ncbi:helix-turn-helix domain containing protein [Actinomycetospora lutea]|uniref:TetR/AcrR family transcriptional regulator n=1 Tax=Actinomycetospora lutea TaxID=663604 RepID=UPI0023667099|nr:TetR/AcrR family transcriptional regulator [Actinomycetospora lutea]MDD7940291.1 helix-turn-helix domain containing protein [Actinomycetospora lutea]